MAELRRSSGAGAAVSRNAPNGGAVAYDDVFGGPPRFSGPFAARMGDYSEIFGGLSSSCSIPVLDLPPPLDGDRGSGLDYSEIFGCFDGWEFAVSYEELLARREEADVEVKKADVFSSNGRDPKETHSDQQATEVSETIPNGANSDIASSEKDEFSSISTHSDDGSKQFNMSYHKTSHGNIEDGLSGKTHIAQLRAVPGFTFNVETRPPYSNPRVRNHNPLNTVNHNLNPNEGLNEGISVRKEGNFFSPSSPTNSENRRNNLETVEKQFFMERPTSEYGPASLKHHSRSSSNHSTSSGEISFPDITYLSVSDISLRTRPLRVPPPSRPPPKFANNQENPKMKIHTHSESDVDGGDLSKPIIDHPKRYDWVASRTHAPQKASRESSSFFDVEVDAGSAAAASAAAMKEAMEQAQARLKSAKESMERKRENFQGRRKLGQREGTRYKEEEEDKSVQEVKDFSKVVTENTPVKSDKKKNDFFSEERENVRRAAKVTPGREEKEKPLVSDEQHRQTFQGNECKLSQSYKLNEKSGAWKTDAQFYELVNNEKKFRLIKEVPDDECAEKIPKKVNMTIKENENERASSELAYAFERNENLFDVNETCEKVENARKPTCHMARMEEETQELPSIIKEAFVQEQIASKLEGIYSFHHQMKNEKLMETQATYVNVEEVNKINASEDAPTCGECENKFESFDDCKLEVHECEEKESKLQTVKVVCGCGDSQELSNVTCQPPKYEEKLQPYNETCMLNGNQLKNPVCLKSQGLCTQDGGEKLETAQRPSQFENFERTRGNASVECCYEETKNTLKGSGFTSEQEESNNLNRTEELYMAVEKTLKHKITQEDDYSEENLEKLKEARSMKRGEDEKVVVEEACMQECCYEETKNTLKGSGFTSEQEESNNLNRTEELYMAVEKTLKHKITQEDDYSEENLEKLKEARSMKRGEDEKVVVEEACMQECYETKASEAKLQGQQNDKQQFVSPFYFELENSEDLIVAEVDHEKNENGNIKEVHVTIDLKEKYKMFDAARDAFQTAVNRDLEDVCQATLSENKDNLLISDKHNTDFCTVVIENTTDIRKKGQRENERRMEKEHEKEQRRKLEEVKEREREREKDKLAVERATREARERAFAEARERAERIAVERVTAVARQRALTESREKAERASAEALEKSLAEKASREARLRAERAAVERATAEARERAVERAVAEKAAADARERAEKLSASSRDKMKKDNEAEEHFRERDKGDGRTRDFPHDVQFQGASSSSSAQKPLGEVESALRCKARLERHQRTSERAAKALSEKNLRDILSQREQAERNRLAESLDADVRRWSSGKEGNLRALLSTLQYGKKFSQLHKMEAPHAVKAPSTMGSWERSMAKA